MACEVQDRSPIEQRILDIGLGGDHHLYPKILLKFLFFDEFDELIVLQLIADLVIDGDLILLRDCHQWIREEICNIDGSNTLLPSFFLFLALLYDPVDVVVESVELFGVAVEELQQILFVLNIFEEDLDLEDAILIEGEVDV